MMAIARVMLGQAVDDGALKYARDAISGAKAASSSLAEAEASLAAQQGAPKAPPVAAPPRPPAELDSDDEDDDEGADDAPAGQPAPPARAPPPEGPPKPSERTSYDVHLNEEENELVVVVRLPASVQSMAQVELDLSSTLARISIEIAGRSQPGVVEIALPREVDEARAKAKFVRKAAELRITAPIA